MPTKRTRRSRQGTYNPFQTGEEPICQQLADLFEGRKTELRSWPCEIGWGLGWPPVGDVWAHQGELTDEYVQMFGRGTGSTDPKNWAKGWAILQRLYEAHQETKREGRFNDAD